MDDKILKIAAELLQVNPSELSLDLSREEIPAWDSLVHIQLVSEMEFQFCINIDFDDVDKISCLADFKNYIN